MDGAATKYPVMLVHGMMVKDFRFYRAFRGITKRLKARGVNVYISHQDGVGSIENNAAQLKEEILSVLEKEHAEKINLIAHSKGGLDARYMISKCGMGERVASLTTLSTPHYGSKMSAKLLKMPRFLARLICFFVNLFYRIFKDKHPDLMTLAKQLRDTDMQTFNAEIQNDPAVYYQSYSSAINNRRVFLMLIPYKFSKYCEGEETDGIVSLSSSKWGNYRGNMDVSADHLQMVGALGGKKSLNAVGEFYYKIVTELGAHGF